MQKVQNLEENLRDLMFHLEAEAKIKEATQADDEEKNQEDKPSEERKQNDQSLTKEELETSTIEVAPAPKGKSRRKKKWSRAIFTHLYIYPHMWYFGFCELV